ncbi:MAG: 3-phosphoshikimate 1-carboxyvinyltransferase [Candidatus Shikimatogenerans bostrichidophilus]|nr:MAG: 3-phosphoshikimate 1-carboxyvinyltransferase [Candidatus Shikimatogenerans bostrichidophilus]
MYLKLKYKCIKNNNIINICGSKSESNRLLIIKKLFNNIKLFNISNSNDTNLMIKLLNEKKKIINVKDAGTVMRFLISYFAIKKKSIKILTGTNRMLNRPIFFLVKALNDIGADIKYKNKIGYPPIKIIGKKIKKNKIYINSNISSQYISSLILIGPKLKNGLIINLLKKNISFSYIKMTINILKKININVRLKKNIIKIKNYKFKKNKKIKYEIESDWSSASYFYSIVSILDKKKLILTKFKKKSLQGDSIISDIYNKFFGVETIFLKKNIIIIKKKKKFKLPKYIEINLESTPDIAQTIIVTCSLLKIKCLLYGLKTLKIKETDRLIALQNELKKNGTITKITNNSIKIIKFLKIKYTKNILIKTYKDHRMAMSFSILAIKYNLIIENPNTVNKSYPNFWNDLKKIGFFLNELKNYKKK